MNEVHNIRVQFSHSEEPEFELMEELRLIDNYCDFIIDFFFFTYTCSNDICNFLLRFESTLLKRYV